MFIKAETSNTKVLLNTKYISDIWDYNEDVVYAYLIGEPRTEYKIERKDMRHILNGCDDLEKANATIEELMAINEKLAADNNNIAKARRKINELSTQLKEERKQREKLEGKLVHREERDKRIIKEAINEYIDEAWTVK